jgi:hypothetical protein
MNTVHHVHADDIASVVLAAMGTAHSPWTNRVVLWLENGIAFPTVLALLMKDVCAIEQHRLAWLSVF